MRTPATTRQDVQSALADGDSPCLARSAAGLDGLIGQSPPMFALRQYLPKVAQTNCNVLITGETGTGKELVARLIHHLGPRRPEPIVCVNCAALPDALLEGELFGYERGAFTGAHTAFPGRMQMANRGTLMLDEIGELTPYAQAKLLRAIEAREVVPLGGRRPIPVNVRIVAATNQNPERLMREQRFRSDLYFRLNVARIHIAPLRERREDVMPLFEYHMSKLCLERGTSPRSLSHGARECLQCHDWPGNVRELRNIVEALFIDPRDGPIEPSDLPGHFTRSDVSSAEVGTLSERDRVLAALSATHWNRSAAAKQLKWSRMTLYRKMTLFQLHTSRPVQPLTRTPRRDS